MTDEEKTLLQKEYSKMSYCRLIIELFRLIAILILKVIRGVIYYPFIKPIDWLISLLNKTT